MNTDAPVPNPGPAAATTESDGNTPTDTAVGRVLETSRSTESATHPVPSVAAAGPGTLAYAIQAWHANHPNYVRYFECMAPDSTLRGRRTITERRQSVAAEKIGVTLDEYRRHMEAGRLWCSFHRDWHDADAFYPEGIRRRNSTFCRAGMNEYQRQRRRRAS